MNSSNYELKRVSPLRLANVLAAVLFVVYAVFALLLVPFMLLLTAAAAFDKEAAAGAGLGAGVMLLMLLAYPILGAVSGWLFGGLSALVYNLVAGWIGGVQMELATSEPPAERKVPL